MNGTFPEDLKYRMADMYANTGQRSLYFNIRLIHWLDGKPESERILGWVCIVVGGL